MCQMIVDTINRGGKARVTRISLLLEEEKEGNECHCLAFRHAGLVGREEDHWRQRVHAGGRETTVQSHTGYLLHGNGELIGGDEGESERVGQSAGLLSSRYSDRQRGVRDPGDLPAGHEASAEVSGARWIGSRERRPTERTGDRATFPLAAVSRDFLLLRRSPKSPVLSGAATNGDRLSVRTIDTVGQRSAGWSFGVGQQQRGRGAAGISYQVRLQQR